MTPRLLDLFCGAGGCARGYQRSGFYVVGVDINPQPRYAGDEFVQGDALDFLSDLVGQRTDDVGVVERRHDRVGDLVGGASVVVGDLDVQVDKDRAGHGGLLSVDAHDSAKPAFRVKDFDVIHASPPCQDYSRSLRHMAAKQPRLIEPTRALLERAGLPWVIENVPGAPLPTAPTLDGRYGAELCGTMFGLRVGWHRLFESNVHLHQPTRPCRCHATHVLNPHNADGRRRMYAEFGRGDPEAVWRHERGTEWMGRYEAREAIPPAYTEFIGHQLMQHIRSREEAA